MSTDDKPTVPLRVQRRIARGLSDEHLMCRMMRHSSWKRFVPTEDQIGSHHWGTAVGWHCRNCHMERIDVIDRLGRLSWRKYIPSDGYELTKDTRPTLDVLRVEFLRRIRETA